MIEMKAETVIKRVIPIVGYDNAYKRIRVFFIDRNDVSDQCGETENVNFKPDDDFSCNKPALYVKIVARGSGNILSLASVGLLSECACTSTTFDPNYMPNY